MGQCYISYISQQNNRGKKWDIQRSIGAVEKWAQRKEEQEKKIKKNKLKNNAYS